MFGPIPVLPYLTGRVFQKFQGFLVPEMFYQLEWPGTEFKNLCMKSCCSSTKLYLSSDGVICSRIVSVKELETYYEARGYKLFDIGNQC